MTGSPSSPSVLPLPITTEHLVLREFVAADWAGVFAYAVDPEVTRHMFFPPRTEADSRAYVARAIAAQREQPRRTYELAVTLRAGGRLIGACDLTGEEDDDTADLGYSLSREMWGRGYATELACALVAAGFGPLGLQRIIATVAPGNDASARVLAKAGLRPIGLLPRDRYAKGRWWDMLLFEILRDDWLRADQPAPSTEIR